MERTRVMRNGHCNSYSERIPKLMCNATSAQHRCKEIGFRQAKCVALLSPFSDCPIEKSFMKIRIKVTEFINSSKHQSGLDCTENSTANVSQVLMYLQLVDFACVLHELCISPPFYTCWGEMDPFLPYQIIKNKPFYVCLFQTTFAKCAWVKWG